MRGSQTICIECYPTATNWWHQLPYKAPCEGLKQFALGVTPQLQIDGINSHWNSHPIHQQITQGEKLQNGSTMLARLGRNCNIGSHNKSKTQLHDWQIEKLISYRHITNNSNSRYQIMPRRHRRINLWICFRKCHVSWCAKRNLQWSLTWTQCPSSTFTIKN